MENQEFKVKFRCPNPNCKSTVIEEVLVEVTQFSPAVDIVTLSNGGIAVNYGNPSHEGGEVLHYECQLCGYLLSDGADSIPFNESDELFEWLQKHNMLEENIT